MGDERGVEGIHTIGNLYPALQLMHWVRSGALRINALSSDPTQHVLAFLQNRNVTTVIENTSGSAQTINLSALPPGNYGVSKAIAGATYFSELGIRTVGADGLLTLTNVPGGSAIMTVYPLRRHKHAADD